MMMVHWYLWLCTRVHVFSACVSIFYILIQSLHYFHNFPDFDQDSGLQIHVLQCHDVCVQSLVIRVLHISIIFVCTLDSDPFSVYIFSDSDPVTWLQCTVYECDGVCGHALPTGVHVPSHPSPANLYECGGAPATSSYTIHHWPTNLLPHVQTRVFHPRWCLVGRPWFE